MQADTVSSCDLHIPVIAAELRDEASLVLVTCICSDIQAFQRLPRHFNKMRTGARVRECT